MILADEPFTGLDRRVRARSRDLLARAARIGAAVILVTHNLDEGLSLATQAAIMNRGRLVRTDERESMNARHMPRSIAS